MDIDNVLDKLSGKTDKAKTYLKGLFNKEKAGLEEQFGDALDEERINILSLIRVGQKYNVDKATIDSMIADSEGDPRDEDYYEEQVEEIMDKLTASDDLEDLIIEEDEMKKSSEVRMIDIPASGKINKDAWKEFMNTIEEPKYKSGDYIKTPSLIIELGATYYLKMGKETLKNGPYEHELEGKYGAYTKWAFKVQLIKVSDEELYGMKYEWGDYIGEIAYVDGQTYTLWLDKKAKDEYGTFWKKLTDDGFPDDRIFTFKHTKKGNYNVFRFALPK